MRKMLHFGKELLLSEPVHRFYQIYLITTARKLAFTYIKGHRNWLIRSRATMPQTDTQTDIETL